MTDATLFLPDSMKIDAVADCKQVLDEAMAQELPVVIDASQVHVVDYSAVQLLVVFARELRSRGQVLSWQSISEVLANAIALMNVAQVLGVDSLDD